MGYARNFERWNHTAELLAMIANTFPNEDGDGFSRADFHPLMQEESLPRSNEVTGDAIAYLEQIGL